ncbi:MAG: hypothetical protein Q4B17_12645 [Lautropia sp.]|nr:hypothetical protein [Lautropia sp.]
MPHARLPLNWQIDWFEAFRHIDQLDFDARSGPASQMQWNHHGRGRVTVREDGHDLHVDEHFTLDNGLSCSDRKCWRFTAEGIVFRHWRQQRYQDILLLVPHEPDSALAQDPGKPPGTRHRPDPGFPDTTAQGRPTSSTQTPTPRSLVPQSPYRCPPDLYDGTLMLAGDTLLLSLRITGERKDEHIQYRYRRRALAPGR